MAQGMYLLEITNLNITFEVSRCFTLEGILSTDSISTFSLRGILTLIVDHIIQSRNISRALNLLILFSLSHFDTIFMRVVSFRTVKINIFLRGVAPLFSLDDDIWRLTTLHCTALCTVRFWYLGQLHPAANIL